MSTVRIPAKHHQARCDGINAQLAAEVAVVELSGRMLELAEAVSASPQAFSLHHAAKLRNACNVALGAAQLIELEHAK